MGLVGCSDKDRASNGAPAVILKAIDLEPTALRLAEGEKATLSAKGTFSDGTTADITALVTWSSENEDIASVSAGEVNGVKKGNTTVTASYQDLSKQAIVQVTPALVSLRVTSKEETVKLPGTVQLEAEAVYSDETTGPVPDELAIEWKSSDDNVATVSATGLVTAVAFGSATIEVQSKYPCTQSCKVSVTPDEGDVITLGKWYDKNGDLEEAITWTVMKIEEATEKTPKRALVVAEKALDSQQYNTSFANMTWAKCSLRLWLTGKDAQGTDSVFYNTAFTEAEKAKIALTEHSTSDSGGEDPYGPDTQDLVFVLDAKEATSLYSSDTARQCKCTEYAHTQQSAYVGDGGYCYWWLRSPGTATTSAMSVIDSGSLTPFFNVAFKGVSVRPAMYIAL